MRLALSSLVAALVAAVMYAAVMRRLLAPEYGILPVLPPAFLALALGGLSLRSEKTGRWAAWAGLVIAGPVALFSMALAIFL